MNRRIAASLFAAAAMMLSGEIARAADRAISEAFAASDPASRIVVDHTAWAGLLSRYVKTAPDGIDRFDYAHVTPADKALLKSYLKALQGVDPARLNPSEQHAYWIDFYNALTVETILEHYPVKSILDISSGFLSFGPWDMELVTAAGRKLSLNNIEHDILRADWHDPRVHYTLNCASLGCPNLQPVPYTGHDLDAQLDAAARAFVNHPRGAAVRHGRLIVSKIYQWYAKDFGGTNEAIIAHIRRYAAPGLADGLAQVSHIARYQYDWTLNAPGTHFTAP